jgi:hypothetical protein
VKRIKWMIQIPLASAEKTDMLCRQRADEATNRFTNSGVIMIGTCSRSLVAVVLGTVLLLMPWGGVRAAEPPAAGDTHQKLVGEWELDLPELSVTYQFGQDGKFTLLFDRPIGGSAGGTWKVDGDALALANTLDEKPLRRVGGAGNSEDRQRQ